ncbi:efflux RND transporter periplasmic adaptor subunit [Maricaulis sp.]|uniref:efflux RND transporter periplasmic adaptor subunit n=1 Tax=Maricaulis sp. TaxID=1486257 RepID=UPI0032995F22
MTMTLTKTLLASTATLALLSACSEPSAQAPAREAPAGTDTYESTAETGRAGDNHADGAGYVEVTDGDIDALGVTIGQADTGPVDGEVELPAEVRFDQTRLAHVSPRVSGIVHAVHVTEGDTVDAGQLLAVLDSRALADAKAGYLSALARLDLDRSRFERENRLWEQQISAEQDFLDARQALEESRIEVRSARQQLEALGIDEAARATLASETDQPLTRYALAAPISGNVIERHAVLGEVIEEGAQPPAFIIADTSTVWVDAAIYGADLDRLRAGSPVRIDPGDGGPEIVSEIAFVSPQLGESTRTGRARIVIDNAGERLRPGMFVTVHAEALAAQAGTRVPATALQTVDGADVVFVRTDHGFEVRPVRIGRRSDRFAEILAGVEPGERIATAGAFALKSELQKGEFEDGHAH